MTSPCFFVNLLIVVVNQIALKTQSYTPSVKAQILTLLRDEPGTFFSGEFLAAKLEVSRVAVWKAVKSLQTLGYPILAGEKGYCCKPVPSNDDFLYPWEFGESEPFFHYLASTDSTMNRAAEFAARGCPGGTVISAGEQTAGRGRNGRAWASSRGGLFFTLLERPALSASEYFRVSLAFQIAAARALAELCGKPIRLKWPNDLYAEGKKIAGLLTEIHGEGDRLLWVSLGLGVNVYNSLPPGRWAGEISSKQPVNCSSLTSRPISRREVLLAILEQWELVKKDLNSPTLHRQWNSLAWGIGKKVPGTAGGIFMGIDEQGRGIIKLENQRQFFCNPGDITIRGISA